MTAFSPLPGAVHLVGTPLGASTPALGATEPQGGFLSRALGTVKSLFGRGSGGTDALMAQQMLAQQGTATATLPANATQLPNATVYSYDAAGNPAVAGLAGLSPQMQQQFGITPQMVAGMTQGVDPAAGRSGAQLNATNQTNMGGMGVGGVMGTAVPVLGQPILNVPDPTLADDADDEAKPPHEGSGSSQVVRNSNSTDARQSGYGMGGWGGFDATGGMATPYTPYGSSMTGAYLGQQGGIRGFFSRLLGG